MTPHRLRYFSRLPVSAESAFAWHCRPDAFRQLVPPWQRVQVVRQQGTIRTGDNIVIRLYFGPLPITWHIVHREFIPNRLFTDEQVRGPFRHWKHYHRFHPETGSSCVLEDEIEYLLPFDRLCQPFLRAAIKRNLSRFFRYRHRLTLQALLVDPG